MNPITHGMVDGDGFGLPVEFLTEYSGKGQWALNAWPNIAITIALLAVVFVLAWKRGYSPVELFSRRADEKFVATLRRRFSRAVHSHHSHGDRSLR
jgi:hypothetical protein